MALQIQTEVRKTRRVLLYGHAKSAKTTTAVRFPKPIVAQDSILQGASFAGAPFVTIDSTASLSKFVADVAQAPEFSSVVLDDFSNVIRRYCVAASAMEKDPRNGFRKVYAIVIPLLQQLLAMPKNLIITAHLSKEMELPAVGNERVLIHPLFPDSLETFLLGFVDCTAYCYCNGHFNALVAENADARRRIVAGCRAGLTFSAYAQRSNWIVPLDAFAEQVMK